MKSGYLEMSVIHSTAMKPLTDLLESNRNLHFIEELMKKKEVPKFRFEALEEKFIGHMTKVCEIFTSYGRLKESYNIKQMLHILKIPEWQESPPLAFYLTPLKNAVRDTRDCLLKMDKEGPLHCKYIIEDNTEFQDKTIFMIQKDLTAQWLAGDELKQDQFKFMYNVAKIIYDSALKDQLLNDKKEVIENVLPALAAYEAIMIIKNILDVKEAEKKKELEKLERDGGISNRLAKTVTIVEEQPEVVTTASPAKTVAGSPIKKGQTMVQPPEKSEAEKEREAQREEMKKYGVRS